MIDSSKVSFSDGQIIKITRTKDLVEVLFKDWCETSFILTFSEVVRMVEVGCIETDIEDLQILDQVDPQIILSLKDSGYLNEKELTGFKTFKFLDSWGSNSILEVVAKNLKMSHPSQ